MIIVLIGNSESGKSTAAKYLENTYNFTEYAIASPIKAIASIFGFTEQELYGDRKNCINSLWGITARKFMTVFGTEICQDDFEEYFSEMNVGKYNIWIKMMTNFIVNSNQKDIVISDARFPDEVSALKRFSDVRVVAIRREKARLVEIDHRSETSIQDIKGIHDVYYNDGPVEDMFTWFDNFIEEQFDEKKRWIGQRLQKYTSLNALFKSREKTEFLDYLEKSHIWIHPRDYVWAYWDAARRGGVKSMELLEAFVLVGETVNGKNIADYAVQFDCLDVLKWLYHNTESRVSHIDIDTVMGLKMLEWLYNNTELRCSRAALSNSIHALKREVSHFILTRHPEFLCDN